MDMPYNRRLFEAGRQVGQCGDDAIVVKERRGHGCFSVVGDVVAVDVDAAAPERRGRPHQCVYAR